MKTLFIQFLEWFAKPSENDEYVQAWLKFGLWRAYVLGVATVAFPVLIFVWWFDL